MSNTSNTSFKSSILPSSFNAPIAFTASSRINESSFSRAFLRTSREVSPANPGVNPSVNHAGSTVGLDSLDKMKTFLM